MTTSDKLREIAEPILADLFEAGMDAQEVGMPSFDMLKTSGYIDRKLSDLTALISEHYTANEEVDKMVEEKLREELIAYVKWYGSFSYENLTDEMLVDEYLKSRESHDNIR